MFRVDSMARATYALAVSFVAVGMALLLVELDYVGVVVVLMMVMEMAVMAVYMVMFMGMNPALMPMSMVHDNRQAVVAAVATFVLLAGGALLVPWPTRRGPPAGDTTAALGHAIMGSKMLVMMTSARSWWRRWSPGSRWPSPAGATTGSATTCATGPPTTLSPAGSADDARRPCSSSPRHCSAWASTAPCPSRSS